MGWYFTRGPLRIVTIPLFLLLILALATSILGSLVRGLTLLRVGHAVFGLIGSAIVVLVGWIPLIIPPSLYYSLMANIPGLWLRHDTSRRTKALVTVSLLIAFSLIAYLVQEGTARGIAWIADQNPCAAVAAGVTGTRPPINCE